MVLAIVWQLMRIHYLQIIGSKTEQDLINWANSIKANQDMGLKIKDFRDKALSSGIFLINCAASIDPRIVDWDLVKNPPADKDENILNAKYAISIARKMGAVIFCVWDDILDVNQKMMLILISSLYEIHMEQSK